MTQFKRFNWYRTFDQSNDSLISAYHSHTNHSRCPASPLFTTTTSSTSCPPSFCVSLLLSVNWWHFRRLELYSLWSQICLSPQCVMPHCSEPSEETRSKHMHIQHCYFEAHWITNFRAKTHKHDRWKEMRILNLKCLMGVSECMVVNRAFCKTMTSSSIVRGKFCKVWKLTTVGFAHLTFSTPACLDFNFVYITNLLWRSGMIQNPCHGYFFH